jgi:hypothetical protein
MFDIRPLHGSVHSSAESPVESAGLELPLSALALLREIRQLDLPALSLRYIAQVFSRFFKRAFFAPQRIRL